MSDPTVPSQLTGELEHELSLEDFKSCRELLVENIKIMERNETFVVGLLGATIAFGIARPNPIFTAHLVIIPVIIGLGFLRFWGLRHVIHLADRYTRDLEAHLTIKWASHYRANTVGVLGWSRYAFWGVLAAFAVFYLGLCARGGPFK